MTGEWIGYALIMSLIVVTITSIGAAVVLKRLRNSLITSMTVDKVLDTVSILNWINWSGLAVAAVLTGLLILTLSGISLPAVLTFPAAVR